MNDQTFEGVEQVFAELDAETTETHYPTEEIVKAINRRVAMIGPPQTPVSAAAALLLTFYAGALWRERNLTAGDGDMRDVLLSSARIFIGTKGGVKRAEALAILEEYLNVEEGTLGTEDEIVDEAGKPIYVGLRVCEHPDSHQGDEPLGHGKVVGIASSGDRDGHAPQVEVQWEGQEGVGPETIETNVRDYAQEGPSGPYAYVAEEIRVVD